MASMKQDSSYSSSNYGEDVDRQANVLASCYIVDTTSTFLTGLHYCTTGATGTEPSGIPEVPSSGLPSPPSSPPLAALTSTNQLALTPKAKSSTTTRHHGRRGGATLRIREECVRFFCETLRSLFLVERNSAPHVSLLTGVFDNCGTNNNKNGDGRDRNLDNGYHDRADGIRAIAANGQMTPPPDKSPICARASTVEQVGPSGGVAAWLEIWDYAGDASFRGFVAGSSTSEKAFFVFFDASAPSRDLRRALVALIEVAEGPLACSHMVICLDRCVPDDQALELTKGLQWAGFTLATLDHWSDGMDVTSDRWLFMRMEL